MSKPVAEMSLLKADQLCMQAGMGRARRDVMRNIAILCAVATLSACSSQPGGRLVWLDKPQDCEIVPNDDYIRKSCNLLYKLDNISF